MKYSDLIRFLTGQISFIKDLIGDKLSLRA